MFRELQPSLDPLDTLKRINHNYNTPKDACQEPDTGAARGLYYCSGVTLRMVNDGPLRLFADKLKPRGELRIATDHPVYLEWTLMVMQRWTQTFDWLAEKPSDFLDPPGGWIETRYGAKARREGRHLVRAVRPGNGNVVRHRKLVDAPGRLPGHLAARWPRTRGD